MTDQSNTQNKSQAEAGVPARRTALKKILAGGGVAAAGSLPAKWTKPVVDAVVLPAHAVASGPTHFRDTVTPLSNDIVDASPSSLNRVIDTLIPTAYAAETYGPAADNGPPEFSLDLCIDVPDGQHFTVTAEVSDEGDPFDHLTASGTLGNTAPFSSSCGDSPPISIQVTSIGPSGANITFYGFFQGGFLIPPGNGCPAKVCNLNV